MIAEKTPKQLKLDGRAIQHAAEKHGFGKVTHVASAIAGGIDFTLEDYAGDGDNEPKAADVLGAAVQMAKDMGLPPHAMRAFETTDGIAVVISVIPPRAKGKPAAVIVVLQSIEPREVAKETPKP